MAIGRLSLPEPVEVYVPARMREIGMTSLVIEHAHALAVSKLPMHPHNPFDRMLVAQAMHVGVPIVTADEAFDRYEVDVIKTS